MGIIYQKIAYYLALVARCALLASVLAACGTAGTPTATLVASVTPSPVPTLQASPTDAPTFVQNIVVISATPDPLLTPTETPVVLQIQPLTSDGIAPPFSIGLPPQWEAHYTNYIVRDVTGLVALPLTVYIGPVSGGTGYIAVLWAFPNLNALQADISQTDLYADGARLLRLAVLEQGCNVGTDVQRQYSVGGLPATGTQFSAVTCPETADIRGWFAGLEVNELNFVFYVYTDPITAIDGSRAGLQAVLDSVRFLSAGDMQATALSIPTLQPTISTVVPMSTLATPTMEPTVGEPSATPLVLETNTPQP